MGMDYSSDMFPAVERTPEELAQLKASVRSDFQMAPFRPMTRAELEELTADVPAEIGGILSK